MSLAQPGGKITLCFLTRTLCDIDLERIICCHYFGYDLDKYTFLLVHSLAFLYGIYPPLVGSFKFDFEFELELKLEFNIALFPQH